MRKSLFISLILLLFALAATPALPATLNIGMQDEPKTLNPFKAADVWSWNVIGQFYDGLYTRNPETFEVIPWIAEGDPEYDRATNTAIVKIKKNVKWADGTPFTAHDVAFTGNVILEFKVPRYLPSWDFITKIEALDDYTVKYTLTEPRATFFESTILGLVVQKKRWEPVIEEARKTKEPLTHLSEYQPKDLESSGPFKFVEWRKGSYVKIEKNPAYFATGMEVKGRKVGPYIDGILFKIYKTTDAAILALQKGDIDYIWWSIQPGYVAELMKDPKIKVTNNPENGLRYLAFNLRKPPFNDKAFRHAVAYLTDKEFIQSRVLQNYGIGMDNVVPPGNKFWFNVETPTFGKAMSRDDRVKKAVQILEEAGYNWKKKPGFDAKGNFVEGEGLIMPDKTPVKPFDILTPPADYDPLRAMSGMLIQEWLKAVGIPATSKPVSFGQIIQKVRTEMDFDAFILGWRLGIDPDYMRTFFHSKYAIKDGNNSMGYSNPEYDRLADESARTMNKEDRRKLIFQMQQYIVNEAPYIPLFTEAKVEGHRSDRFTGWVEQLDGIGNGWSLMFVKPVGAG
ncbi:MAG: ABC transporter substrate-binding protein [Candidatus Tectomicrobia bacterium]|nr:ABC transporter substrate-binding protein [Candidatus Tectomicrobia bacterium]